MTKKHNPGSEEAIKAGCTCPILDNARGKGYMGVSGVFVYNGNCQYHVKQSKNALKEIQNDKEQTLVDLR